MKLIADLRPLAAFYRANQERKAHMKKKTRMKSQVVVKVTVPDFEATSFTYGLGVHVRDVLTGFEGAITGRVQYLTGCTQYLVQPRGLLGGKTQESFWIDEGKLTKVARKARVVLPPAPNGGPQLNEAPKH